MIDRTPTTIKVWIDTREKLNQIKDITGETIMLIVSRLVVAELKKITNGENNE